MRIGMDYDDTYTAAPAVWRIVILIFSLVKIKVVCVSSRRDTFENRQELEQSGIGIPIYLTGYNAKAEFMRKLGLPVDVWIDDHPHTIDPDGKEKKPKFDRWKNGER